MLQAGEGPEFVMAVALVGLPPAIDPFDAAAHHHLQAHGRGKRVAAGVEAGDGLVQVGRQHAGHQAIVEGLRVQVALPSPRESKWVARWQLPRSSRRLSGAGKALRVPGDVPDEAVEELSAGRQGGLRADGRGLSWRRQGGVAGWGSGMGEMRNYHGMGALSAFLVPCWPTPIGGSKTHSSLRNLQVHNGYLV